MHTFLHRKIKENGLIFSDDEPIVLNHGQPGKWIFDLKSVFMDSEALDMLSEIFWDRFEKELPFQIGGLEMSAIPLLSGILMKAAQKKISLNGFIIRKERKNTGRCKQIEGTIDKEKIILVDDVFNSGNSLNTAKTILKTLSQEIESVFVVVDFENQTGKTFQKQENIKVNSLFTLADFSLKNTPLVGTKKTPIHWQWSFAPPDPNYFFVVPKSTPALDEERLYYGTDSGIFYALDQRTGKVLWQHQTGNREKGIFSSPVLHEDVVFFGGYDGNFYALFTKTGKTKWVFDQADWIGSSPAVAPDLNLIFVGLEHAVPGKKGALVALDINTGEKQWEWIVSEFLHGTPVYLASKQLVAVGTNDASVLLFHARNGRLLWRFQADGAFKSALCFDEKRNVLIAGSFDGVCYGIDMDSGQEIFRVKTENVIYSTPLVFKNRLYVTSTDKHCYVYDLEKKEVLKKIRTFGKIYASPVEIDGSVCFGGNDGIVREVNPDTLEVDHLIQLPERITCKIIKGIKSDRYYVSTYDNRVWAFSRGRSI